MSNNWWKEPRFHFSHEGNYLSIPLSIYLGSIDPPPALNHELKICFYARSEHLLSYSAAEEACQEADPRSHLPSVHSFQEIQWLVGLGR